MANNVPGDKGSKEATFTALAADFKLDDKVTAFFLDESMENLEDLRSTLPRRKRPMSLWPIGG